MSNNDGATTDEYPTSACDALRGSASASNSGGATTADASPMLNFHAGAASQASGGTGATAASMLKLRDGITGATLLHTAAACGAGDLVLALLAAMQVEGGAPGSTQVEVSTAGPASTCMRDTVPTSTYAGVSLRDLVTVPDAAGRTPHALGMMWVEAQRESVSSISGASSQHQLPHWLRALADAEEHHPTSTSGAQSSQLCSTSTAGDAALKAAVGDAQYAIRTRATTSSSIGDAEHARRDRDTAHERACNGTNAFTYPSSSHSDTVSDSHAHKGPISTLASGAARSAPNSPRQTSTLSHADRAALIETYPSLSLKEKVAVAMALGGSGTSSSSKLKLMLQHLQLLPAAAAAAAAVVAAPSATASAAARGDCGSGAAVRCPTLVDAAATADIDRPPNQVERDASAVADDDDNYGDDCPSVSMPTNGSFRVTITNGSMTAQASTAAAPATVGSTSSSAPPASRQQQLQLGPSTAPSSTAAMNPSADDQLQLDSVTRTAAAAVVSMMDSAEVEETQAVAALITRNVRAWLVRRNYVALRRATRTLQGALRDMINRRRGGGPKLQLASTIVASAAAAAGAEVAPSHSTAYAYSSSAAPQTRGAAFKESVSFTMQHAATASGDDVTMCDAAEHDYTTGASLGAGQELKLGHATVDYQVEVEGVLDADAGHGLPAAGVTFASNSTTPAAASASSSAASAAAISSFSSSSTPSHDTRVGWLPSIPEASTQLQLAPVTQFQLGSVGRRSMQDVAWSRRQVAACAVLQRSLKRWYGK